MKRSIVTLFILSLALFDCTGVEPDDGIEQDRVDMIEGMDMAAEMLDSNGSIDMQERADMNEASDMRDVSDIGLEEDMSEASDMAEDMAQDMPAKEDRVLKMSPDRIISCGEACREIGMMCNDSHDYLFFGEIAMFVEYEGGYGFAHLECDDVAEPRTIDEFDGSEVELVEYTCFCF